MLSPKQPVALLAFVRFLLALLANEVVVTSSSTASKPYQPLPPVSLSPENFDEITANKTAFILFYAPYCAHSQNLLPAWNQLRIEWQTQNKHTSSNNSHQQGLVAQVDCTTDKVTQRWCDRHFKVLGFPTLLFGDPSLGGIFLTEYNGDKDYLALSRFANATLSKPVCSPANVQHCDAATQSRMQSYLQLSEHDMEVERQRIERQLDDIERKFQKEFKRMQTEYDAHSNKFDLERAAIKDNLKALHAVKASL